MKTYGYARVSSKGQTLENQISDLIKAGINDENIFAETVSSRKHQPKRHECFDMLQAGDTLVVTRLDRLGRTSIDLLQCLQALVEKKVAVRCLKDTALDKYLLPNSTNNASQTLLVGILIMFAQFERSMILERANGGRLAWREKNDKCIFYKTNRSEELYGLTEDIILTALILRAAKGIPWRETVYSAVSPELSSKPNFESAAYNLLKRAVRFVERNPSVREKIRCRSYENEVYGLLSENLKIRA